MPQKILNKVCSTLVAHKYIISLLFGPFLLYIIGAVRDSYTLIVSIPISLFIFILFIFFVKATHIANNEGILLTVRWIMPPRNSYSYYLADKYHANIVASPSIIFRISIIIVFILTVCVLIISARIVIISNLYLLDTTHVDTFAFFCGIISYFTQMTLILMIIFLTGVSIARELICNETKDAS